MKSNFIGGCPLLLPPIPSMFRCNLGLHTHTHRTTKKAFAHSRSRRLLTLDISNLQNPITINKKGEKRRKNVATLTMTSVNGHHATQQWT